jgi:hypothetical protein
MLAEASLSSTNSIRLSKRDLIIVDLTGVIKTSDSRHSDVS